MADNVKRLYRSRKERMLGGICGGLGEYFHLDPTLMRLITVVLFFVAFPPSLILVYLLMWIIIPPAPEQVQV